MLVPLPKPLRLLEDVSPRFLLMADPVPVTASMRMTTLLGMTRLVAMVMISVDSVGLENKKC